MNLLNINKSNLISRDLSWLNFNCRVLDQAKGDNRKLLDKLKFLSIVSSNFDEFFEVRVGSLYNYIDSKKNRIDYSGMREIPFREYLLEKSNGSIFTKYFLDFFSLKSDYNLSSNDKVINSLSLAKKYLSNKEVGSAIDELKNIQNTTDLFNDWIEHALVYNESMQLVLKMKKELLIK